MDTLVEKVEQLLMKDDVAAVEQLLTSENDIADQGMKEYCWGRYYNVIENYEEAIKHLNLAKELLPDDRKLYGELAFANDKTGNVNDAEQAYLKMYALETDYKYKWAIMSGIAGFYSEHHMYLKMEKVGKKLCQEYKTNYQGYHIMALAKIERKQYKESELILKTVPESLKELPQYIDDLVYCYELQKKYNEILQCFEENEKFSTEHRKYVLKKRIMAYSSLENYKEAENSLLDYVFEYGEIDGILSLALLLITKGDYDKSISLCKVVQKNITEDERIYDYFSKLIELVGKYMGCMTNKDQSQKESVCDAIDEIIVYSRKKSLLADEIESELQEMKANIQSI